MTKKTFFQTFIASIVIGTASLSFADGYDRKDFNYRSYKPDTVSYDRWYHFDFKHDERFVVSHVEKEA